MRHGCQGDFVPYVTRIMPDAGGAADHARKRPTDRLAVGLIGIGSATRLAIDTARHVRHNDGDIIHGCPSPSLRSEDHRVARDGHAPSPSGPRARRDVRRPPLLRSPRSCASEIRDAAATSRGGAARDAGRCRLQCQPTGLLRSRRRARGKGPRRLGAGAPWAEAGPQVHRRDPRFRGTVAGRRGAPGGRSGERRDRAAIRHRSSSPVDRACARATEKKTSTPSRPTLTSLPACDGQAQYEALRREAVTTTPFCEPRGHGMALLMTRGMSAWLSAVSMMTAPVGSPAGHPTALPMPAPVSTALTHVLATMVLACTEEAAR